MSMSFAAGWDKEKRIHLGEEMADVTLYSILLSTHCELDLPAALKLQATPKVSQEVQVYA